VGAWGQLTPTGVFAVSDGTFGLDTGTANARTLKYAGGWGLTWSTTTGDLVWLNANGGTFDVQMLGTGVCWNKAGSWNALSDERLKQDIEDYTSGLAEIVALRPRSFRFKSDVANEGEPIDDIDAVRPEAPIHYGLIAQECQPVMPEAITQRSPETIDGVHYDDLLGVDSGPVLWALVNAVKELASRNAALEARLAKLEAA
jgi:hypothetical protein